MNAVPDIAIARPLSEAALAAAIEQAVRAGSGPLAWLESHSGLEPELLARELAAILDYEFVDARLLQYAQPEFGLLSATEAARRNCVVVRQAGLLYAIIVDPFDTTLRPWLEARIPQHLRWAMAAGAEVSAFIARHAQALRAIDAALDGAQAGDGLEGEVENLSLASIGQDQSPVVRLVHSTVFDALRAGASDVHLETTGSDLVIRYRIDGVLLQVGTVRGVELSEQVVSRIKVMSELDIAERRVPQDGRFKIAIEGRTIDFRVSIIPSVYGEDAVLRVLDKQAISQQSSGLRLAALGFDRRVVSGLTRLASRPHGMLLVTGPTGSGKTTTLYAAISETKTGSEKIVTIEDPVEYQLPGVLQIPVNEKKGLTFARGLRSILRHDPDKIMVGEIRDPETAQIAIQSALTGHLVFTTVHANNVFDVLNRFTHMGVDVYSFTAALNGILAQRLVRVVCDKCAQPVAPPGRLLEESGIPAGYAGEFRFSIGRGCAHCRGSGYRGRRAIGELLVLNDEIREAIVARVPVRQLKELATRAGVRFIRGAALSLVRQGVTTLEEANRVTAMA
ncbi:MAG: GspE/PulE family protein [Steroidobacteraceae bacterium]